jgi:hypothetical protein
MEEGGRETDKRTRWISEVEAGLFFSLMRTRHAHFKKKKTHAANILEVSG